MPTTKDSNDSTQHQHDSDDTTGLGDDIPLLQSRSNNNTLVNRNVVSMEESAKS